jgi:hypothetical protein
MIMILIISKPSCQRIGRSLHLLQLFIRHSVSLRSERFYYLGDSLLRGQLVFWHRHILHTGFWPKGFGNEMVGWRAIFQVRLCSCFSLKSKRC